MSRPPADFPSHSETPPKRVPSAEGSSSAEDRSCYFPLDAAGNVCSCRKGQAGGSSGVSRRSFLQWTGLSAAAAGMGSNVWGAQAAESAQTSDHFVPVEKNLSADWLAGLTAKGQPTWYQGKDLDTIAMPIGGLCAGQLYLSGEGRLAGWWIFNDVPFTGYGATSYQEGRKPPYRLEQGFALWIRTGQQTLVRPLSRDGFAEVRFCGEYPIGFVEYQDKEVPVSVRLEAYSPFIPLNTADSALPATVLEFTLKNTSAAPVTLSMAGWLENKICGFASQWRLIRRSYQQQSGAGWTMLLGRAE
ncbi:MAG TPA: GH116 family glycosyl-hydrolase, partial [Thermoguttaceae bacterium]|nr:GH116 family glycosyl-hydrolase [Thermoguttaceae bacterium]